MKVLITGGGGFLGTKQACHSSGARQISHRQVPRRYHHERGVRASLHDRPVVLSACLPVRRQADRARGRTREQHLPLFDRVWCKQRFLGKLHEVSKVFPNHKNYSLISYVIPSPIWPLPREFTGPQNRSGADLGTCLESPFVAKKRSSSHV